MSGFNIHKCSVIFHRFSIRNSLCAYSIYDLNGSSGVGCTSNAFWVSNHSAVYWLGQIGLATNTGMGDRLRAEKLLQYFTKPLRPTQPPTLIGMGYEYQPKW